VRDHGPDLPGASRPSPGRRSGRRVLCRLAAARDRGGRGARRFQRRARADGDARVSALGTGALPDAGGWRFTGEAARRIRQRLLLAWLAVLTLTGAADDRFGVDDLTRLTDVAEPAFSPDGEYLAYSVTTSNLETSSSSARRGPTATSTIAGATRSCTQTGSGRR